MLRALSAEKKTFDIHTNASTSIATDGRAIIAVENRIGIRKSRCKAGRRETS